MGKLLSWIVLAALVYAAFRLFTIIQRRAAGAGRQRSGASAPKSEPVVRCEVCGVHVPRSEAITAGDHHFCCEAHRSQAR